MSDPANGVSMDLYVIRRPAAWADVQQLEATAAKSAKVGEAMPERVSWIRSYVVREPDGSLGTVCIYQARDEQSIRDHAEEVGMPGDAILPVLNTVVVRLDPSRS